jgi:hypothetical protein
MSVESVGTCPDHGTVVRIASEAEMKVYCAGCGRDIPAKNWYGVTAGQAFEIEGPQREAA